MGYGNWKQFVLFVIVLVNIMIQGIKLNAGCSDCAIELFL
jgi:hypothetical protein